jgi:hypothetical protein
LEGSKDELKCPLSLLEGSKDESKRTLSLLEGSKDGSKRTLSLLEGSKDEMKCPLSLLEGSKGNSEVLFDFREGLGTLRAGAPLPAATFFAGQARQKKQLWSAPALGALLSWGLGLGFLGACDTLARFGDELLTLLVCHDDFDQASAG